MIKYLAEAYRDYSETEYICVAREYFDNRKDADNFLKDKCADFQNVTEIQSNNIKLNGGTSD